MLSLFLYALSIQLNSCSLHCVITLGGKLGKEGQLQSFEKVAIYW
jgi:hypothetical protein